MVASSANSLIRVLAVAEACNPEWTSVPLVGYNMVRALAERTDLAVTLATHVRNRPAIERDVLSKLVDIEYIDNERIAGPLYRFASLIRGGEAKSWTINTALAWPSYIAFEHILFRQLRGSLDVGEFDLIHRITPVSPTLGSPLAGLTRIPMILGPLNGGLPWPREYPEIRRQEREWLAPVRSMHRFLPYYRSTWRRAAAVICGSRNTAAEIPASFAGQRLLMAENGVDPARFPILNQWRPPVGPFCFVTACRLVPLKGLWLVLEAMNSSETLRSCKLVIIGDGPDRARLEEMVERFGLRKQVQFAGWMNQQGLADQFARSQAFVLPTLKDFGGGAVLEAMASALPSIVVDYGGPAELLNPDCGFLLPLRTKEFLTADLRQAMETLANDSQLCLRMASAASQRVVTEFLWSRKADRLREIYQDVLDPGPHSDLNGAHKTADSPPELYAESLS